MSYFQSSYPFDRTYKLSWCIAHAEHTVFHAVAWKCSTASLEIDDTFGCRTANSLFCLGGQVVLISVVGHEGVIELHQVDFRYAVEPNYLIQKPVEKIVHVRLLRSLLWVGY